MLVDDFLTVVGAAGIIGLLELQKRFIPRTYFSFGEIITGFSADIRWHHLVLRLLVPFVVTFLVVLISPSLSYTRFMAPGVVASVLIVWPALREPSLLPENLRENRRELYLLYVLFVVLFGVLSHAGGVAATWVMSLRTLAELSPTKRGLVDGLWGLGIAALLTVACKKVLERLRSE